MSVAELEQAEVGVNFSSNKGRLNIYTQKVTPELAQKLLDSNHANNRKIKPKIIEMYARLMSKGLWRCDNGEGIKISQEGKILDGQHRLAGVIEYGKPVEMLFFSGIPEAAITSIDDGVKRTLSDAMIINGKSLPNQGAVNGAVKCLFTLWGCTMTGKHYDSVYGARTYSTSEQIDFFDALPKFRQVAAKFFSTFKYTNLGKNLPQGIALAIYYLFHDQDEEMIFSIFKSYETGIPFDNLKEYSPCYHATRKATKAKELKGRIKPYDHIATFIWVLGKSLEGKRVEKMPSISWNWDAKNPITASAIKKLKALDM